MGTYSGLPRDFVFQGSVVKQDENYTTVRMFPGLDLDLRKADIAEIDEAADEVTQRPFVRIKLKEGAEVAANFTPRLARLALANEGVPFAYGGFDQDSRHSLPSGSLESILPLIDRRGLALFQGKMPEANWGDLAGGVVVASDTATTTTKSTETTSSKKVPYDTPYDLGPEKGIGHKQDEGDKEVVIADDTSKDTPSDKTDTGDWY